MKRKRLLSMLVLLMTVVTGAVAQGPWTSGDCTVTISGDVMTVSGTGAMADYEDPYNIPWDGNNYDVKTIVIESGVTSIGKNALASCYNLESVSIPASVTSIGEGAFEEGGLYATALTVSFAEGSTPLTIGESAFNYANLKSIDIPNRVTSIGERAFVSCYYLESVSIPASVTSIGNAAFQYCGSYAEALTVSFAEGSTPLTISESAFYGSNLKFIDIPNRVTSIGVGAFQNCTHLESVSIPASVTSIGKYAFDSCEMLAKVSIYAPSLTTYGAVAFEDNAAGRKIYVLPEAVDTYKTNWPAYAADIEAMTLYATSVKEGTEDAESWSAPPSQATEGQKVTITYSGTKSVKSVTAKRKITTGNITVYFTDAQNYGDVHVYYWSDGPDWPGTPMTYVETNEYSQKIYRAEIPAAAVGIIFNGNGRQTADITENIADGSWWYTKEDTDDTGHNKVGYVGKYTENIVVTNVDANNWTFTMPDGNVELDIEYYPAYPVTINAGDAETAKWSATPTEQSVGQNVTLQYTGKKKIKRITIEAVSTARTAAEATAEDIGKLIGADGNIYDDAAAATAASTTAVAVIAYVGTASDCAHGLAIALADEGSMNWATAKSTCEGKTAIGGNSWKLPTLDEWKLMFIANGGSEYSQSDLNTALAAAGGDNSKLKEGRYWTLTEEGEYAWNLEVGDGDVYWDTHSKGESYPVRAVLAFRIFLAARPIRKPAEL